MHIAVFCPSFGAVGGIEQISTQLISEFQRADHAVTVLARRAPSSSDAAGGAPVLRFDLHQLPRRARHIARHLRFAAGLKPAVIEMQQTIRERRIDVVLTLAISTYAPYMTALAQATPVVVSLQGGEADAQFTSRPRFLRKALVAASHVIACATTLATQARDLAPVAHARVSVIPNGVDPSRFADTPPFTHARPYILAVGRLVRQKGFDILLEAFASVRVPTPIDLLIAGDGPERTALEALRARLALQDRVHLLGVQSQDRLAALYRGASIVSCPSRWEGLPLVCLEGMASGRPVVATSVDGIPDAVRHDDTGILVPPERADVLGAVLTKLLLDPLARQRLGANAHRAARDFFAWPAIANRYLAILSAAIHNPRRGNSRATTSL